MGTLIQGISEPLLKNLVEGISKNLPLNDIRILIASGADLNGNISGGLRPLHFAVFQLNYDYVKILLVRGADPNFIDLLGYAPIHMACEKGALDIVVLLYEFGAKVNWLGPPLKDITYYEIMPGEIILEDPLGLAIKNRHYKVTEFLLQHGANPNQRYFLGSQINLIDPIADIKFLELLLKYGANPNVNNRSGLSPLMIVAKAKMGLKAAKILVKYNADLNFHSSFTHDSKTAIHYAVIGGNTDTISFLLESGGRINMRPGYAGPAPLDLAIFNNDPELCAFLLNYGADPNRHSPTLGTPLHIVGTTYLDRKAEIMECLLRYGADPNFECPKDLKWYMDAPLVEYIKMNRNLTFRCVHILLAYGAQAVFRFPTDDHRGLLKCLHLLNDHPDILNLLMENGQNFDVRSIKTLRLLTPAAKKSLKRISSSPRSLKHCVRIYIRNHILHGTNIFSKIHLVFPKLPIELKYYLACF